MSLMRAFLDAAAWRRRLEGPIPPRGLSLFAVQAGGCDGCAAEIAALRSGAYDLAPYGLRFAGTPRDAELLLLTGGVTRAMAPWIAACWRDMPAPKGLIAIGDCAVGGGPFGETYAALGGVATLGLARCDMTLRGCPPEPAEILRGLLRLASGEIVFG